MSDQGTLENTPLQNLFYYIRDLYNTTEPCYDFEQESGNAKSKDVNYWEVEKLLSLSNQSKENGLNEFHFSIGDSQLDDYVLKVKRISIPPEPIVPPLIADWIVLESSPNSCSVAFKDKLNFSERFSDSAQRIEDFENYCEESKTWLFEPSLPSSLKDWVKFSNDELSKILEKNNTVNFADDKERVSIAHAYKKDFIDYCKKYYIPRKTNNLYDTLHTLYYELKGKESRRLYISFGLVCGRIGNQEYKNFLFHVPLKLRLKNQELILEKDTFSNKIFCEQHLTELLNSHFVHDHSVTIEEMKRDILQKIDLFNSRPKEFLFEDEFIRSEYYDKAIEMLGLFASKEVSFFENDSLLFEFRDQPLDGKIAFSFSPIIQTKIVESQIAIANDANNIINKINELQANDELHLIPDFFKKLFQLNSIEEEIDTRGQLGFFCEETKTPHTKSDINYRSLFPLPYNEEQIEIARRLNEQDAVTVKGPPGTGKSHTIANLISNYVAQGKSILVVSHNSKALRVLKDKLPIGIKDLAVSLVNDGSGNENLKASVNYIIRSLSQRYEEEKVIELELHLEDLENRHADTLTSIYKMVQANSQLLRTYNPISEKVEEKSAYEWAVFHFEQNNNYEISVIKDNINFDAETADIIEVLNNLISSAVNLTQEDLDLVNYHFIDDAYFIGLNELRSMQSKVYEIEQKINIEDYALVQSKMLSEKFDSKLFKFDDLYQKLAGTSIIKELVMHPKFDIEVLGKILIQIQPLREQIELSDQKLLSCHIDLFTVSSIDSDILHQQINQLILKFEGKENLSWLTKRVLDKQLKSFFECKFNYIPASTLTHFKQIEVEINRRKCLKQLSIYLNNYLSTFGFLNQNEPLDVYKEFDLLLELFDLVSSINLELKENGVPVLHLTAIDLNDRLTFVKNIKHYHDYEKISAILSEKKAEILNHERVHNIAFKVADALESMDKESYEINVEKYRALRNKQLSVFEFKKVYDDVFEILPITANYLKELCLSQSTFILDEKSVEYDLFYMKVNNFLTRVTSITSYGERLLANLQNIKSNIERQTAEVVSYKTWYHKSMNVTDLQKTALSAWLNDLINIGKGYGKNTARNIASSIKNMQVAKGAVPIWIMPQETAITFFPDASPEQFDLLIIDEASQCDISSMNLIFRCKKCLIVGDENQTSVVSSRGTFTIKRTNEMLDKYLMSHRFKTQFDINNKNNSIYTISTVIYPNIVTLTEHFRCLPEIIEYSNKYIYNSDIVPLRTATESLFGESISIHYVEDNYLDDSKPLIVQKVVAEIESIITSYIEGRIKVLPTIGVIVLDSSNLKYQNLLVKEIAKHELIGQYSDKLDLLIGTSREFQGDERDVILMTITASHRYIEKNNYEIRPPSSAGSEEYMRIFNVAASRAKEKSIVIHSIHPDAVAMMNSNCYRKKLIDYYNNYQNNTNSSLPVRNLQSLLNKTDSNSGEFEKGVCKFLYEKGLGDYLEPQYKVGKYCIDFGIIKNNKKIAIECDGFTYHSGIAKIKEDINRQLILERAGWKFYRIQSTDWFYRNLNVSRDLSQWIEEMI